MRKKIIISIILGVVLVGCTTAVVALNSSNKNKEEIVENAKGSETTDKKEENKLEEKVDTLKEESEEKKVVKEEEVEVEENIEKKDINNKEIEVNKESEPKEQTIDEGYQIFYKARDAYEREDFDEAIRLYETMTNKDALAKVEGEKWRFYTSKDINDQIDKGQRLYDEGKYLDAKIFMSKLMRGNYMMPKQEARAQEIYNNAEARVTPEDESKSQKEFTYDKALAILKQNIGDNPDNTYEYFQENLDINGEKTIYIGVRSKKNPESGMMYLVGSGGSVISAS